MRFLCPSQVHCLQRHALGSAVHCPCTLKDTYLHAKPLAMRVMYVRGALCARSKHQHLLCR